MSGAEIFDLGRSALWTTVGMSAPVMMLGLAVGLVIALFQALTQIQEMTLVFVPKILVIFASLIVLMPVMAALLAAFSHDIFTRIAGY